MRVAGCLQVELESATSESNGLKEKLQYQQETAATSLNRIQKQGQQKCTELHTKIRELNDEVFKNVFCFVFPVKAHTSLQKAQQEVASLRTQLQDPVRALRTGIVQMYLTFSCNYRQRFWRNKLLT